MLVQSVYEDLRRHCVNYVITRMWANAQRDGRPAEYRWRRLFNAANLADAHYYSAVQARCQYAKPVEICWGPKLANRSQPLMGRSSPYCGDMWRTYCCLISFLSIVDTCLSCEDIARQFCAMVPRWRFLATFLRPVFSASRV